MWLHMIYNIHVSHICVYIYVLWLVPVVRQAVGWAWIVLFCCSEKSMLSLLWTCKRKPLLKPANKLSLRVLHSWPFFSSGHVTGGVRSQRVRNESQVRMTGDRVIWGSSSKPTALGRSELSILTQSSIWWSWVLFALNCSGDGLSPHFHPTASVFGDSGFFMTCLIYYVCFVTSS